jgi:hypothetical protein
MKKIYLSVLVLSTLAFASFGQYEGEGMMRAKTKSEPVKGVSTYSTKAPGDIIGSVMDFSNPANWVVDNTAVTGTGWVIGSTAPAGPFSGGMGVIASTSGGDFALFDADGSPGVGYIQMANPIDLSAYSNVALEFESYYRNFTGFASFEVSLDGSTWSNSFPVHSSLPLNESTANPQVVSVNISGVVANQSTVWVRFKYESTDDYAWMIDDVKFVEGYDDELILEDLYMSAGVEALDYYRIPTDQLQSFTYGARAVNGGLNNQVNTAFNVVVNDGSTDIYDETSTPVTVNAFTSDSLEITQPFTAPGNGTYTTTFDLYSDATDQNIQNNSKILEPIEVGGDVYARDNGTVSGSVGHLGSNPVETLMGQYFEFPSDFFVGQVEVGIANSSAAGGEIYVELRKLNAAGDAFDFVAGSDPYIIQAGDVGNNIRLNIAGGGYLLQAGDVVEVLAGHYGSPDVRVTTAQIGIGAVIYNEGQRSAQNSLFHVRPIKGNAGLENENAKDLLGINVYPNPVDDNFTLSYNLTAASDIQVEIRDVTGKVVFTSNESDVKQGNHTIDFKATNFTSGVYFAVVKSEKNLTQRKFIVK